MVTPPIHSYRRYDLDWLRIVAVFMLIPYHSSRIFDTWEPFYVKNAETSVALTGIRALLDPWGMPLLFVIAGAASFFALRRRSGGEYLGERVLRLIIPLLFGCAVIVPPQAYLAWLGQGHQGTFWEFFGLYWAMKTGEFMGFTGGFTLGHLWFILFLFVFSAGVLPLFLFFKSPKGARGVRWLAEQMSRPGALFLVVIPFWLTEPLPGPIVGLLNPFAYVFLFVTGYVLVADVRFQDAMDRSWRWALGLGAVTLAAGAAIRFGGVQFAESSWESTARDLLHYFTTWAWVIGALGFGHTHLNRFTRWLPYLNGAAYPVYLLHQTVILAIGFFIIRWNADVASKFLVIAIASLGTTLGIVGLARRWSLTRAVLGTRVVPAKAH